MIVFFGSAGAGKSMQGQMLAARHGWRWLSAGQLLRENNDPELLAIMAKGHLVPPERVGEIVFAAADAAHGRDIRVILDGYPRSLDQAEQLIAHEKKTRGKLGVDIAIYLKVDKDELLKRLQIRGRTDDTPSAIEQRLNVFTEETTPIFDYFRELGIPIVEVEGTGTVGEIHDRIEAAIEARGLETVPTKTENEGGK